MTSPFCVVPTCTKLINSVNSSPSLTTTRNGSHAILILGGVRSDSFLYFKASAKSILFSISLFTFLKLYDQDIWVLHTIQPTTYLHLNNTE